ncbi:MAG: 1-acyl-sn-glycerol-3-phosphate acyltransferase [Prevotellaceae bacterium]|nr:1-acyl-sn-glycerol-3-phosphate acyltransferase [Prevotellaceae bacterium]
MGMNISKYLLRKFGWKIKFSIPQIPDKCVLCLAPHTSNWDFILGKLAYWSLGRKGHFLIKKSWTVFPLSLIFKPMGAIPVDRKNKSSLTEQVVEMFHRYKKLNVAITPEGTRKRNPKWKRGFYFIAQAAKVPIVLASLDYQLKTINLGKILVPSGNVDSDMQEIQRFYKSVRAKNPHNFAIGN